MPRNRQRNRMRSKLAPQLATIEQTALNTADTAANVTLFAPPLSTSSILERFRFRLNTIDVTITDGNTAGRIYAVVRKVPAGYTSPSIAITNSLGTFADVDNVLAYSIYNVSASVNDPWDRMIWRYRKREARLISGDAIVLQVVTDTSSSNQAFSVLAEYGVGSV